MSDPDYPAIETTSGDRPRNTLAERGIVILAALTLVAGGLIALGNMMGKEKGVSKASSSPAVHATPRPTPQRSAVPTPTPREVVLIAGTPPSEAPSQGPWPFNGWVRALADQPLRGLADSHAAGLGIFSAGEIAYADEQPESPGWLHLNDGPGQGRWVRLADGGTVLVEEITPPPVLNSGDIWSVAAGPKGFVTLVTAAALSDRPSRSFVAYSADGAAWQRSDLPPYISTVAWGPAGWLALGTIDDPDSPTTWVFVSGDGLKWTGLGAVAGVDAGLQYAGHLLGSPRGYLLQAYGRDSQHLWFSPDGVTWVESSDPILPGGGSIRGERQLAAIGSGFLAWMDNGPVAGAQLAYSTDGRRWLPIRDAPRGGNLSFTSLGDRIIAAVTDPENGSVSFRTGAFHRSELLWAASTLSVPGAGVAALVSDTRQITALLWDRATDRPIEWTSTDGLDWRKSSLAEDTFGGIPRLVAGGPKGVVAVGYRPTARGTNPILWHEVVPGGWAPERSPMLPIVSAAGAHACSPPPQDFLGFIMVDRALAVVCFGRSPITLRAWSLGCDQCYGDSPGYDPTWLANPTTNQLFLSPIESEIGANDPIVLSPTLTPDATWIHHWVEITGHFDDPAAPSCHWTASPSDDAYYSGQYWVVNGCRQQFVVTAVRLVNPP